MLRHIVSLSVVAVACAIAMPAAAQVIQPPERQAVRARRSEERLSQRVWQQVTFAASTLAGYDDNPIVGAGGSIESLAPREPGYTGYFDGALRFERRAAARSLELEGRAFLNTYHNVDANPSHGGSARANWSTAFGGRHRFDIGQDLRDEPFYAISGFVPLRVDVGAAELPDANPVNGFVVRRSWAGSTVASLSSRLSRKDTVAVTYTYDWRDFKDDVGDGRNQAGTAAYARTLGRTSSVRGSYRYSESEYTDASFIKSPSRDHSADVGLQYDRQVSRTKRLALGFGGGASALRTVSPATGQPYDHVLPIGYGNVRFDLGRTWNMSGDYRRSASVLEGLTPEAFVTDAAMVRAGGYVASSSEVSVAGAYSEGTSAGLSASDFTTYTFTAQFRQVLGRSWSAIVNHTFYKYRLFDPAGLPPGLPPNLERQALRVGLSLDVPVYRSEAARRQPESSGRN